MISEAQTKNDYKVVIVDDDDMILDSQSFFLENDGFEVVKYRDGDAFLHDFAKSNEDRNKVAVVILDIMMEPFSGLAVLKSLRLNYPDCHAHVVMYSAKDETYEKISCLKEGADDYISKTMDHLEFIARIEVQYRAFFANMQRYLRNKNSTEIELDRSRFSISLDGGWLKLTRKEFQIVEILASAHGKFVPQRDLQERVFGYYHPASSVVRTCISRLRKKVHQHSEQWSEIIINDRYEGYALALRR